MGNHILPCSCGNGLICTVQHDFRYRNERLSALCSSHVWHYRHTLLFIRFGKDTYSKHTLLYWQQDTLHLDIPLLGIQVRQLPVYQDKWSICQRLVSVSRTGECARLDVGSLYLFRRMPFPVGMGVISSSLLAKDKNQTKLTYRLYGKEF